MANVNVQQPPINRINLISYDIHSHEGLDQTIQNLANLEQVFLSIASKVESRLQQTKNKLRQIEERRTICMRKIETLANLNVALTIYSPAKYIKPYKFDESSQKQSLFYDLYLKPHIPKIESNAIGQNQHSNEELGRAPDIRFEEYTNYINMLYVRLKQKIELFEGEYAIQNKKYEGLGEIPSNLKYVESLLVFGSKINPYKHYSAFDTFQEAKSRQPGKKKEEKRQQDVITEAPETIMQGDTLQHYEQRQYNFKPALKELPQIMLPTDLSLKGIVNMDFQNLADSDPFMPSKGGFTKNLPTMPEPKLLDENIENVAESNVVQQQTAKNTSQNNMPTTYTPGSMVTFNTFNKGPAPVYKPPENNPISKPDATSNNTIFFNVTTNTNAPPPPLLNLPLNTNITTNSGAPPPPSLLLPPPTNNMPAPPLINNLASLGVKPDDDNDKNGEENKPAASSGGGGGRSALLDEIRCENPMARLRKVGKVENKGPGEMGAPKEKKNEPKQSHMDYLKEMVLTRYKAINKKSEPTKKTNKTKEVKAESDDDDSENSGSDSD